MVPEVSPPRLRQVCRILASHRGKQAPNIPDSAHLCAQATLAFRQTPSEQSELNWRVAALVRGTILAYSGEWERASDVFDPTRLVREEDVSSGCKALAALMATSKAVAMWRAGLTGAYNYTTLAFRHYDRLSDGQLYDRWRAINATVQALTASEPTSAGSVAQDCVDPKRQPELLQLILRINGQGDGQVSSGFGRGKRTATIHPWDLYRFNEPAK